MQTGGHKDIIKVNGKVNKYTILKLKNRILTCSVKFILVDRIIGILTGELIFQFHRHYGNTVEEQHNINTVFVAHGIVELTGAV